MHNLLLYRTSTKTPKSVGSSWSLESLDHKTIPLSFHETWCTSYSGLFFFKLCPLDLYTPSISAYTHFEPILFKVFYTLLIYNPQKIYGSYFFSQWKRTLLIVFSSFLRLTFNKYFCFALWMLYTKKYTVSRLYVKHFYALYLHSDMDLYRLMCL